MYAARNLICHSPVDINTNLHIEVDSNTVSTAPALFARSVSGTNRFLCAKAHLRIQLLLPLSDISLSAPTVNDAFQATASWCRVAFKVIQGSQSGSSDF